MTDYPWLKKYEEGVPPTIDIAMRPLAQLLRDATQKYADQVALHMVLKYLPLGLAIQSRMTFRQLVNANQFWSFNGVVGLTDAPLASASRGETLRLEIVNDTAFPHAMHLHGIHFREVSASGSLGPMRDTVLLFAGETREIAFAASHPGKWLFHCHMLSHTASGMATWIEVT